MKVLLDIKESKVDFILELLGNMTFVKAKPLTAANARFLEELAEAVENVGKVKAGKLKARPAKDLLNEL